MIKFICLFLVMQSLVLPVSALDIKAPDVPISSAQIMPKETTSFGTGLIELLQNTLQLLHPDLTAVYKISIKIMAIVMTVSMIQSSSENIKHVADLSGVMAVSTVLLGDTDTMIRLASQTIHELSDYGKLLFPVMATAMAAQGNITASTSNYIGTSIFDTIAASLISTLFVPLVYFFLTLSIANSAVGEDILKKLSSLLKGFINWCLRTLLIIFTTYMSITGIVSGTADAATLKAAKVTISSIVPVVGGILSDASETILVSVGLMKNAAGIYGILAVLAIFLKPFMRIGLHYLLLKTTGIICSLFATKRLSELIEDFSNGLGILLAMTASMCLLLLIGTICFMKGVG